MRLCLGLGVCVLCVLGVGRPARANFHLMQVIEIFPGTAASPNAQYVTLQMLAAGQNVVGTHSVTVYGATGKLVGTFTFGGSATNAAKGDTLWIATAEAKTFFSLDPDLTMTPVLPMAGGAACFDVVDCAAWGSYTGSPLSPVGTPFRKAEGLVSGQLMKRKQDMDTNNCASDFALATPAPTNNARKSGTIPASTCPNAVVEGLEECDDGGSMPGDGCSATCTVEPKVIPDAGVPDAVKVPDAGKPTPDATMPDALAPVLDAATPDGSVPTPDAIVVADAHPSDAAPGSPQDDMGGCDCRMGHASSKHPWLALFCLLALAVLVRRRAARR